MRLALDSLIQRSAVVPMVVEALDDAMCKFSVMHVAHGGARRAVQRNGGPGFLPNTGVEYVYKVRCPGAGYKTGTS